MKLTPSVPSRTDQFVSPVILEREDTAAPSVFWSIASVCWLATVFILYSRFFDLFLRGLYIPRIVLSLTFLFFALSGRPLIFLRSATGKIVLAFMLWATFTLIFSVWKSGSLPAYGNLLLSMMFFVIAASLPNSIANAKKSHYALALSGLFAALMSIPWGIDVVGRLALPEGSYLDPNYYAMGVLAVVPFFWEMAATTQSKIIKIFAWLSMGPLLLTVARAGSRGAIIGLGVMLLLLMIISPLKTKIALVLVAAIGFTAIIATVPSYLRARYLTIFSLESQSPQGFDQNNPDLDRLRADAGSSEGRRILLMESISLTLEHPLVGVGPGNFQVGVYDKYKAKGIVHNEWMATHNSYTQISSETGLPGLTLLLLVIGSSFSNVRFVLRSAKATGEKPNAAAYAAAKSLLLSLAIICTCIFFLAVGYDFTIYVWAGLTISLRRAYEETKISGTGLESELEGSAQTRPVLAPAYSKVADPATRPGTAAPKESGRAVRFNRFR